MAIGIPIIDKLLGIGEKIVDRVIPDKNKRQDQEHELKVKQVEATVAGEQSSSWTPRKIIMMAMAVPVVLQLAVKPVVEWAGVVVGYPVTLPSIDITAALKIIIALLGLDF